MIHLVLPERVKVSPCDWRLLGDNSNASRNASPVRTSFVAKCFSAANTLLKDDVIDDAIRTADLDWLAKHIGRDGRVVENRAVFSLQLMGAMKRDGDVAYTAIVFVESSNSEKLCEKYQLFLDSMV